MDATRLFVISDLHIAPAGPLAGFHAGDALARFVTTHARAEVTLVIAGDMFDLLAVEGRPGTLDMPAAPDLLRRVLADLAREEWARGFFAGLAALLRAGGRCVVLPGNHDAELNHPACRDVLLEAAGLPGHPGLTLHLDDDPLQVSVGGRDVVIGHGHRVDRWNDVDPAVARRAVAEGRSGVILPPGSRLCLDVLNPFKRATDDTGARRFSFVDLLKPEMPAVALLLLYLDPRLALTRLTKALGMSAQAILRPLHRWLFKGRTLAGDTEAGGDALDEAEQLGEALAARMFAALPEAERTAPSTSYRRCEAWLEGLDRPLPGTLANHSGVGRRLLRAWLADANQEGGFFDDSGRSRDDEAIMASHLDHGNGSRLAIFGHTHAARHLRLDGEREYINTGTWMDLMEFPSLDNDVQLKGWIDALDMGIVPRRQRLTYAEVTVDGAWLREWPRGRVSVAG